MATALHAVISQVRVLPDAPNKNGGFVIYTYNMEVTRVVDGDTIHARVDLGFDSRVDMTLRLARINAPELKTEEGKAAFAWLKDRLYDAEDTIVLRSVKDRKERYGRYLAEIDVDGVNINDEMVSLGLAVPYDGKSHPSQPSTIGSAAVS